LIKENLEVKLGRHYKVIKKISIKKSPLANCLGAFLLVIVSAKPARFLKPGRFSG
jgi:hypothetical protein